jgi:sugar phosphate isomerase/epimerase
MGKKFEPPGETDYPEIFLAIDNCFASKRYTEPGDWMSQIRDLDVSYVEASADNECDPLYQGRDYLLRWVDKVYHASTRLGVSVCNLYSGHGTYSTLGLAHTDPLVRERMLNCWVKPMMETAAALDAGLGFFCHAFPNPVLQNSELYEKTKSELIRNLAEVLRFAHSVGCKTVGLEQMYTPHQIPWTIEGSKVLLEQVGEKSIQPLYLTIDTGHQSGQRKFLKPGKEAVIKAIDHLRTGGESRIWLGSDAAYQIFENFRDSDGLTDEGPISLLMKEMDAHPYLFALPADGSTYGWLEELACFSPIIHLQQTDGSTSGHWPFTRAYNEKGIIDGMRVLEAIRTSYENRQGLMIPKAGKIYLTIEVFAKTDSINYYTLAELRETVRYWRQFIPEDGRRLNELL